MRWGQDERNEPQSGPIFGLAVSQGESENMLINTSPDFAITF